ncbi:conserved hypothetical protein [Ricinus communis]|uniref:Uncharacterized protein n=1 Tax=Ricinus communis TaxID=3988 RepID=B9SS04_RICCO|nr:conserved hypothetical protein [Ricinus communis]
MPSSSSYRTQNADASSSILASVVLPVHVPLQPLAEYIGNHHQDGSLGRQNYNYKEEDYEKEEEETEKEVRE